MKCNASQKNIKASDTTAAYTKCEEPLGIEERERQANNYLGVEKDKKGCVFVNLGGCDGGWVASN